MMADDLRRERIRRAGEIPAYSPVAPSGAPSHTGQVLSTSTAPGIFLKYQPVTVRGTESEGSSGVIDTRSANRYAVNLGPATALAGDLLVMRSVGWRWVCEKTSGGSPTITLPGCPCLVPTVVTMTSTTTSNFNMFQSCVFNYGTDPSVIGLGMGMYSTAQFADGITGDLFWYRLACNSGVFGINRLYDTSAYGSPFSDAVRMSWTGGTCTPFYQPTGHVYTGGDASANGQVILSG